MIHFLEALIIHMIMKLNGERSVISIYHIIKGKKSFQTIQDCHLYGLETFFGTFQSLQRDFFEETVQKLINNQYISIKHGGNEIEVTFEGKKALEQYMALSPFPKYLHGYHFQTRSAIFWKRLSLVVQTVSHLIHGHHSFYPIQRDLSVQAWVKRFLKTYSDKRLLGEKLYGELFSLLNQLPELQGKIFVSRLSAYHRIGLTNKQLAEETNRDEAYIHILFLDTLHFILMETNRAKSKYEIISMIAPPVSNYQLTESSKATYSLIKNGFSIERAAKARQLKVSTIEDHIVEMALFIPEFSIDPFVDKSLQNEIMQTAAALKTKKLKPIKNKLQSKVSYFQIRLVLAKSGDRDGT
jgi:uncharacterized protein YpbB